MQEEEEEKKGWGVVSASNWSSLNDSVVSTYMTHSRIYFNTCVFIKMTKIC